MTCPRCAGRLLSDVRGSSLVVTSEDCGWSVATSYIEPQFQDDTTYRITLDADNPVSKSVLAAVSSVAGGNWLRAKTIVESAPTVLAEDLAPEVMRLACILTDGGVAFSVDPDLPYEI